jgi:putative phosphotransacetylase
MVCNCIFMKKIKIEVSARHVHVTQEDLEILFGENFQLENKKDLSQKGQFASNSTVKLVGAKNEIDNVRIIGPVRSYTQVEISRTDAFNLGVKAPLRLSGKVEGSGKIKIVGPAGEIDLQKGVIVAKRHLHLSENEAYKLGLKNGQEINIRVDSERPVIFEMVEVRVNESFSASFHIDTDEANAGGIFGVDEGEIVL